MGTGVMFALRRGRGRCCLRAGWGHWCPCVLLQHPQPLACWGRHSASLCFLLLSAERSRRKGGVCCIWALKAWEAHFTQCYVWRELHLLTYEAKLFKYHWYVNIYICKKKKKICILVVYLFIAYHPCLTANIKTRYKQKPLSFGKENCNNPLLLVPPSILIVNIFSACGRSNLLPRWSSQPNWKEIQVI